jgi:hypothetical protein
MILTGENVYVCYNTSRFKPLYLYLISHLSSSYIRAILSIFIKFCNVVHVVVFPEVGRITVKSRAYYYAVFTNIGLPVFLVYISTFCSPSGVFSQYINIKMFYNY